MNNASISLSRSVMKNIPNFVGANFDALGVTERDFEITTGDVLWQRPQISTVMRVMQALLYGSLEQMGVRKLEVPTEFVAAVIAVYIQPVNQRAACMWLEEEQRHHFAASDLSQDGTSQYEIQATSARRCYAMVIQLAEKGDNVQIREQALSKLGIALEKAAA